VPPPAHPPIGLLLTAAARSVGRAFDDALAAAGGSRHVWLLLLSLKSRGTAIQRELSEAVGLQEATVSQHLSTLERSGLIARRRDPVNLRTQLVELTPEGEATFRRLRRAAGAFDRRLRAGLSEDELLVTERVLRRLQSNAAADGS
jgi:MarR family transcriptional regulator for hemolysin